MLCVFSLLALGLDYLATMLGAITGGLIGLFFVPFGLIVGPFVGAMGMEWAFGQASGEAAKAGLGAVIGIALGAVGKLVCSVIMTGFFVSPFIFGEHGVMEAEPGNMETLPEPASAVEAVPAKSLDVKQP